MKSVRPTGRRELAASRARFHRALRDLAAWALLFLSVAVLGRLLT